MIRRTEPDLLEVLAQLERQLSIQEAALHGLVDWLLVNNDTRRAIERIDSEERELATRRVEISAAIDDVRRQLMAREAA